MKKIGFLFLAVFLLLLGGCSGRSGAEDQSGAKQPAEKRYYVTERGLLGSTCTFSELGVLRSRSDGEHIGVHYFFDPVSGKEVPLCTKTNCTHRGYGRNNPHPDCDACLGELTMFAAIIGDSLYYVSMDSEDGFLRKKLCRADPNGTNRKVLEVMEDAQYFQTGTVFYENGYLIYITITDITQDGTSLEKRRAGICLYDPEKEEAEYVTEAENYSGGITSAIVLDHSLYYFYQCFTEDPFGKTDYENLSGETDETYWKKQDEYRESIVRTELWAYDLDTKEKRLVMQESGNMCNAYLRFGYACIRDKNGVRFIDISTGESREPVLEKVDGKSIEMIEEGVLLTGDGSIDLWEFETGEVKHIGSYDKDQMISWEYIGQDWVYGTKTADGQSEVFYLPREQFMRGELEWKYLPQED